MPNYIEARFNTAQPTFSEGEERRLAALSRIAHSLSSALDLDDALIQMLDAAIELTNAGRGFLVLLEEDAASWSLRAARNNDQVTLPAQDLEPYRTVIADALSGDASRLIADAGSDLRSSESEPAVRPAPGAIMVAPLLVGSRKIGAILMDSRLPEAPFTQSELELLKICAAQTALKIENDRLQQAVQNASLAKSRFVSIVSHELRVPMTSIKGYADLLRQGVVGSLTAQQTEFVDIIRNNVERMSILVSDLADINRIETGRLFLETAPIALADQVEDILTSLQSKFAEKQHWFTTDIPADLPVINTDPLRLMQVLTNLINNACKYTPAGGEIQILAVDQGDGVRIEVVDNGIGISSEDQARLFTQFFRSDDSVVREEPGWGLGLSVSKLLIELMGGELGFSSTLGSGSTFWFRLPYEAQAGCG
ncbi:MAG: GAF domain-containing sensor histidine kinase [Anaerolineales bacterium]|nr:GAF domain-containing sensor histidine kinase [Anaerolineales bacterium]